MQYIDLQIKRCLFVESDLLLWIGDLHLWKVICILESDLHLWIGDLHLWKVICILESDLHLWIGTYLYRS
jgi:hypothetical protein